MSQFRVVNVMVVLFITAMFSVGCASNKADSGNSGVGVQVHPSSQVMAMAQNPTPPAGAKKAASVGSGPLAVNTANSTSDVDFVWTERIDIDSDGVIDDAQILYDDEDGVLYFFADDAVSCAGGGTAQAGMLLAVNCKGNPRNRPVGSGWCAVSLDARECGAQMAGIYACRFDANGNVTAWAMATIDATNDDIVIMAADR